MKFLIVLMAVVAYTSATGYGYHGVGHGGGLYNSGTVFHGGVDHVRPISPVVYSAPALRPSLLLGRALAGPVVTAGVNAYLGLGYRGPVGYGLGYPTAYGYGHPYDY